MGSYENSMFTEPLITLQTPDKIYFENLPEKPKQRCFYRG